MLMCVSVFVFLEKWAVYPVLLDIYILKIGASIPLLPSPGTGNREGDSTGSPFAPSRSLYPGYPPY